MDIDSRLAPFMAEESGIERDGEFFVRDGYRVKREFVRNIIWPMAHFFWEGVAQPPDGKIYVPTQDVTGEGVKGENTRLRIEKDYIGIGCQLIPREQLEILAYEEGWYIS